MVLILLSIIIAATVIAISMINRSFGGLAGSELAKEKIRIGKERYEQPTITGPTAQFLIVVLPDGKVVSPLVADRF